MKKISLLIAILILSSCQNQAQNNIKAMESQTPVEKQTIYQFKVTDLYGKEFDFSTLKGKKIMVVNTASRCGLTPQYEKLEELYTKYKSKNFVIVGFPANDFLMQEPGSNEDIAKFCKKNYGVSFPMMSKISVNGKKIHPVYKFLTKKSLNGLKDNKVEWNFQKYLIGTNGHLVDYYFSITNPMSDKITKHLL